MILITGANGQLGSATIDFLLKKNPEAKIKALVRSEEKGTDLKAKGIEIAIGDYMDYDSLLNALTGVETLLLISSSTLGNRGEQHANVIKAAKESGVKHIVYTSILKASPASELFITKDHVFTESLLKESGIKYTILRNTYYLEYLPGNIGNAVDTGAIYYSSGDTKSNFASRTEMAEGTAAILSDLTPHVNKIYEFTSGTSYSFGEIAEILSEVTGKEIKYVDIPYDALKDGAAKAGLPNEVVEMIVGIAKSMKDGEFDYADNTLENLIGRKPVDAKDFIKSTYSK